MSSLNIGSNESMIFAAAMAAEKNQLEPSWHE